MPWTSPRQRDGAPHYGEIVTRLPHPARAAALAVLATVLADPERDADDDAHALRLVCQAVGDLWVAAADSPDPLEELRAAIAAPRLLAIAGDRRL